MSKYILQSDRMKGRVLLEYAANGLIRSFHVEAGEDITDKFTRWMFSNFPVNVKALQLKVFTDLFTISEVKQELNFDAFWSEYGYRIGKKSRAERLWNAMSEAERAQAMTAIGKYNIYLSQHPGIEKAYPETWLSQRRWENQYK